MSKFFRDHPRLKWFCVAAAPIAWEGILRLNCLLPGSSPGFSIWGIMTGVVNLIALSVLSLILSATRNEEKIEQFSALAAGWIIAYTSTALLISLVVDVCIGAWAMSNGVHTVSWTKPFWLYLQGQLCLAIPLGLITVLSVAYLKNRRKL